MAKIKMKEQAGYLCDATELRKAIKDALLPLSENEWLRVVTSYIWYAAKLARMDEHLHYCARCRHRDSCSRLSRIRKGLS